MSNNIAKNATGMVGFFAAMVVLHNWLQNEDFDYI